MSTTAEAFNLTNAALGRLVTVTDYAGRECKGRLDRIELDAEPRTRVVLRIAQKTSINKSDGGGFFWSTAFTEFFVDRTAVVQIGPVASAGKS